MLISKKSSNHALIDAPPLSCREMHDYTFPGINELFPLTFILAPHSSHHNYFSREGDSKVRGLSYQVLKYAY